MIKVDVEDSHLTYLVGRCQRHNFVTPCLKFSGFLFLVDLVNILYIFSK